MTYFGHCTAPYCFGFNERFRFRTLNVAEPLQHARVGSAAGTRQATQMCLLWLLRPKTASYKGHYAFLLTSQAG